MTSNIHVKSIPLLSLGLFTIFTFMACARKVYFATSAVTPAAEGKVKLRQDDNGNYIIDVSITHLAPPKKLSPPRDMYIVWMETGSYGIKNIGRIKSRTGFLSTTLKGSLRTVTPAKPTKVFITAENERDIRHPGTPVVLTTKEF